MKFISWCLISSLIVWVLVQLQDIWGYSLFIQNTSIILFVSYFFYLLDVSKSIDALRKQIRMSNKNMH